jgi:sugar lactone lactonase YvrE
MAGLVLLILIIAYLLAWPVPIRPVAWQPPAAPPAAGVYAPNDRLRHVETLGRGIALGPEATAIDAEGRVYTGTSTGRILRLDPATGTVVPIATTGGRPLGMAFEKSGRLLICDADKGLLALSPSGTLKTLVTQQGGVPFRFTNDVDVAPDGIVYFTDTSRRFSIREVREAILEHGGGGRLMAYDPASGKVGLLLSDLQFANGVAVSGDGSFVLVAETGAYRVTRYWLAGPKRGTSEPFIENLPGLPDNVTWSSERHAFWIALYSPRLSALDLLARHPLLRKIVYRLPLWIQPQPARHAWALAVDEQGKVVANLQDTSPDSFAPVTSIRERDGTLWLGSLEREALGRIRMKSEE